MKVFEIVIIHPCGHIQNHGMKAHSQGQAYESAMENYFDYLCDDCLDRTGTRANPMRHPRDGSTRRDRRRVEA